MSKSGKQGKDGGRQRHISVHCVRRNPPDLRKLSRALIALAMEQAAAEAAAQAESQEASAKPVQPEGGPDVAA